MAWQARQGYAVKVTMLLDQQHQLQVLQVLRNTDVVEPDHAAPRPR